MLPHQFVLLGDHRGNVYIKKIITSNHMFKREIWDKFTEFTFLKF